MLFGGGGAKLSVKESLHNINLLHESCIIVMVIARKLVFSLVQLVSFDGSDEWCFIEKWVKYAVESKIH